METVLYVLPSLMALVLKAYLLFLAITRKSYFDVYVISSIASLTMMNLLEFTYFIGIGNHEYLLKIYYVVAIFSMIFIIELVSNLTKIKIPFYNLLHVLSLFLIPLILFTTFILQGTQFNGISITRIPGSYYWLFQLCTVIYLVTAILLIFRSVFDSEKTILVRAKSSVLLVSILPGLIVVLIMMFLMALHIKMNLVFVLPLVSTIFAWGCLYTSANGEIIDFSIFIPGSPSWRKKKELLFFFYAGTDKSKIWQRLLTLEKMYIEEALVDNKGKGQLSNAARDLGITPGKLDYRLKNIHNLDQ